MRDRTIRKKMKTLRRKRVENREDAYEIMVGEGERLWVIRSVANFAGDSAICRLFSTELPSLPTAALGKNTVLLM